MTPNVPRGAVVLLDYIGGLETARQGDAAYQTVVAHLNEKDKLPKPITEMTLDELLAEQLRWVKELKQPSGAAGKFQIIRPTLQALITQYNVPLTSKFTPGLQDAFGYALLKKRGYDKFMAGTLSPKAYGNELAKEWASLPLLSPVKRTGKNARTLQRGQSYYDAVAGNKSLDTAMSFEVTLSEALNEARRSPPAPPKPCGFPVRGAKDDEVVAQVQRRLKELGYTEIGNVDGDFGDLTEKAILIFRHDAGLPVNGTIDEALIVALTKAAPRELPEARQNATPAEVREVVPEARANWVTKIIGLWGTVGAAVLAFINWAIGSVADIRRAASPVLELVGTVPGWVYALVLAGIALWIYLNGRKGLQASVAAVQEGARR